MGNSATTKEPELTQDRPLQGIANISMSMEIPPEAIVNQPLAQEVGKIHEDRLLRRI